MIFTELNRLYAKVVYGDKQPEYIVPGYLFEILLNAAVSSIRVDEDWYLARYEDVGRAIEAGFVNSAAEHYRLYGYKENRQPRPIKVDEDFYRQQYPDIVAAIEDNIFESGQQHFERSGFAEGRLPYPNFSLFRGDR
ncbi:hypothetical protein LG047_14360 [Methylocystis sp. WRRC1]|uniref:hypothetical protein n=1 Tax=unclassified Methylocystis TaxID=2625913 RepID=UPI0001F87EA9|nr:MULTISPECIES: hypothetical protein [unclassified Methylocystis]MCC3246485.1 hypothetical protein [Methylocystis sp. WRRC1]